MYRSLFLADSDDITFGMVKAVIDHGLVETAVLDYKKDLGDGTLETIAAMANSDGGVILLGVQEERGKSLTIVGVNANTADRLADMCSAKLQPRFVPELISLRIPEGPNVLLVVRVNPETSPLQTVLRDKGILVRNGASNRHADLQQLIHLFSERNRAYAPHQLASSLHPSGFLSNDATDFLIRVGIAPRQAASSKFLTGRAKRNIFTELDHSPVTRWFDRRVEGLFPWAWQWTTPNTSQNFTAMCIPKNGESFAFAMRVHASLSPSALILDVGVESSSRSGSSSNLLVPMTMQQLFDLIIEGFASLLSAPLLQHLDRQFVLWPPRLEMHIKAKTAWLHLHDFEWATASPDHPLEDSCYAVYDEGELGRNVALDRLIRDWLTRIMLDKGALNAEVVVGALRNHYLEG